MKKSRLLVTIILLGVFGFSLNWAISSGKDSDREQRNKVDTRIDNSYYWVEMAEEGYIDFNPDMKAESGIFTGSKIQAFGVLTEDSPDVPVTEINSTQSENSVFVDPNNSDVVLNSNNSTQNPVGSLYGANDFHSFDASESWEGQVEGAGGGNSGDPTTAIGLNGRWYVNYISSPGGMGIAYSDDQGGLWTTKTVAPNPGSLADKNHMWIDNSISSPHEGNLYVSWTNFGGSDDSEIAVSYSHDDGETWVSNDNISGAISAGSHNQGVNLGTGPNGEVYAIWGIYDSWPSDESAIGFSKSLDGGLTWSTAERIITNIRGIRTTETSKNHRVNSFPVCAVDISNGPDRGAIYITWSNVGTPGENTGSDIDVYLAKSVDGGATWGEPVRVNQDEAGLGKEHYFPWVTVDPANGAISLVYYDDRNVSSNQSEVFCANSFDGGLTFEDFKVSDVSFTPAPIPGLAGGYFGDYLGIIAQDGWVYPVWTDNRTGTAMTYCSPYQTNPLNRPANLMGEVAFETGAADLNWSYEVGENFLGFKLYRDGEFLAETTDTTYTDMLPDYGVYFYQVSALYTEDMESSAVGTSLQWGDAHISVDPLEISDHLVIDTMSTHQIRVINTGQLDLIYNISALVSQDRDTLIYCDASGGGDEYISKVEFGDVSNTSGSTNYADFTDQFATLQIGESIDITVTNGNPYSADQCAIWIDWDQNGEFDDDEVVVAGTPGNGPYTATITPPDGAVTGDARMRIRVRYTGSLDPCGATSYGEVEDYTIKVQGWLGLSPNAGSVLPGDTTMIDVTFDSHDMEAGLYTANAVFTSNDPLVDEVNVALSLLISAMLVEADSDQMGVCLGEDAMISSTIYGPDSEYSYSWTSVPAGFTSTEAAITVTPDVSTWYYVSVSDTSSNVAMDSIFMMVYDLPIVNLGADTSFCGDIVWTLDAGNPGSTYLWSTGETTQTISVDTTGYGYGAREFMVDVTDMNACSTPGGIVLDYVNCTGINELAENVNLNIYPNPSEGVFNVKFNTIEKYDVDLMILSSNGSLVYSKTDLNVDGQTNIKVDISAHAKGVYQLLIKSENGIISKRLIMK